MQVKAALGWEWHRPMGGEKIETYPSSIAARDPDKEVSLTCGIGQRLAFVSKLPVQ